MGRGYGQGQFSPLVVTTSFVDKLIEIVKAKIFLEFHSIKIKIHLGWVANSMVIFSAS